MPTESPNRQAAMWEGIEPRVPEAAASSPGSQAEREPRLKSVNRRQLLLRTIDVEQLVAADHPARALWDLVGRLDLSGFREPIAALEGRAGRPAWDPQLLISLWVYAYSEGVGSAREVERRCAYHPAYQWLTGLETVNHHTLSDFRIRHQAALDRLFADLLAALSAEGLITLEQVMHDGTKVKAAASGKSFRRAETLREHLEKAREQVQQMGHPRQAPVSSRQTQARQRAAREKVDRLQQALEEMEKVQAVPAKDKEAPRRVSTTDPEARIMKQGDGGFAPSHNVQLSTDAAHGIIVGVGITQAGSDQRELLPALEEIETNLGRLPEQMVADGGYTTHETVTAMAERGVEFIGGVLQAGAQAAREVNFERRGISVEFRPEAFTYEASTDTYTCPAGKVLAHQNREERAGVIRHRYQAAARDCRACPFRAQCCPQTSRGRQLVRTEKTPEVAAFLAQMQTERARQIYRRRGAVAEFSNLWLKAKLGLRQFRVRGLKKVRCEVLWACLTYNLQQWIRLRGKTPQTQAA
jgi:transposase